MFTKATEIFLKWGQLSELLSLLDFWGANSEGDLNVMFLSKVINNLLSAHVSFESVFQKLMLGLVLADLSCGWDCNVTWSELCPEPCMLLRRRGVLVAPKQVLSASPKCVVLILYFVFLFFHPRKCFSCGLDPTRCCHLTVGRCKNTMGPTSTSCCVLNCIFNENKLQDNCAHPPLPASLC